MFGSCRDISCAVLKGCDFKDRLEKIKSEKSRPEQVGRFLEFLRSSDDIEHAFATFCDSLTSITALEFIAQHLKNGMYKLLRIPVQFKLIYLCFAW